MIKSLAQDDVDHVCSIIAKSSIKKTNRMYFLRKGLIVLFDENYEICIVKYKSDVVPLFVFKDENSISRIKKKLLEAK